MYVHLYPDPPSPPPPPPPRTYIIHMSYYVTCYKYYATEHTILMDCRIH